MSSSPQKYVLDANAFIQAKRRWYGFDFCTGYWNCLILHNQQGRICSIDRVEEELLRGGDDLTTWARDEFGHSAFATTTTAAVAAKYAEMLTWVMAQTQFLPAAKSEYQQVADGWLAAYAKAHGSLVVTLEQFDPIIRKKVPLPNVCRAFDVGTVTPFEMLRGLGVDLSWQPRPS